MRKWLLGVAALVLVMMTMALAPACSFLDEDAPGRTCKFSGDCFSTQGETCNATTGLCEKQAQTIDAGTD